MCKRRTVSILIVGPKLRVRVSFPNVLCKISWGKYLGTGVYSMFRCIVGAKFVGGLVMGGFCGEK